MQNLNKILLIQTAFPGDVILATGLLESLHQALPNAHIDFLVRKGNETLLENNPAINEILVWDKRSEKIINLFRLIRKVRKTGYDAVINMHRFASSGLITWFSGASIRSGFNKNPFSFSFTHRYVHKIGDGRHEIGRNLELLSMIPGVEERMPKIYPGENTREKVKEYKQKPYICIAPGSVWFTKMYPAEKWIEMLKELDSRSDNRTVYLIGSPNEYALCEKIKSETGKNNIVNLAGKLSFPESAALMQGAEMNYVNDSAPLHLAGAMDAPVTAIFCSTVPAFGFGPLSGKSRIVETEEQLECRPCGLHGYKSCPRSHFRCAYSISVKQILD